MNPHRDAENGGELGKPIVVDNRRAPTDLGTDLVAKHARGDSIGR